MKRIFIYTGIVCFGLSLPAAIVPASIFTDNMVLQQDKRNPVWGTSSPGEKITVQFAGQNVATVADIHGNWRAALENLSDSAEGTLLVISGRDSSVTFTNVVVGEVWLCSGQSNMAGSMEWLKQPEVEIAAATNFPMIRLYQVKLQTNPEKPGTAVHGQWTTYNRDTAADFSAVASYFGRALNKKLNVPIGLIQSAVGGTEIESWIGRSALEQIPFMPERLQITDAQLHKEASGQESREEYAKRLDDWRKARAAAKKAGQRDPGKPILVNAQSPHNPSTLFNGMIAPLSPFALRGVIWYQGESNESRPEEYNELLAALIRNWRGIWEQGDFPFIFVQLANFKPVQTQPNEGFLASWAYLREQQQKTLAVTNTGMVVITDAGELNIHPKDKKTVGERLALAARAKAYGEDIVYSGPLFRSLEIKGSQAVIHFTHTGSGLIAKGDKLTGFAVSGGNGQWCWADASIAGDTVILTSPQVPSPTAVCYNWADNPIGNLYNKEGLPASLFSTDK